MELAGEKITYTIVTQSLKKKNAAFFWRIKCPV